MEDTQKPVEQAPDAGQEQENQDSTNTGADSQEQAEKPEETQESNQLDPQKVIDLLEESDKALAAAETKIVSQKRELKRAKKGETGDELEEEDLDTKIDRRVKEQLASSKQVEQDADLEELKQSRKRNAELRESLRASITTSNSSVGSGQSKSHPEVDLLKGFGSREISVIERRAAALNITPQEYVKKKNLKP